MSDFYAIHQLADHVMATVTPLPESSRIIHITVRHPLESASFLHWGLAHAGGWEVPPDPLWPEGSEPYIRHDRIEALRTPLAPTTNGVYQVRLTCPPQSGAQAVAFVLYDPQYGYQHNAGRDFAIPLQATSLIQSSDAGDTLRVQDIAWAPPMALGFLLPQFPLTVAVRLQGAWPPHHLAAIVWEGPDDLRQEISLAAVQSHAETTVLRGTFLPPRPGHYRYRVVLRLARQAFTVGQGEVWIAEPRADEAWTQGPLLVEIADGLFLGNAAAAANPRIPAAGGQGLLNFHGVKAVLNAAEERDPSPALLDSGIDYAQFPFQDGAHNPLNEGHLQAAVQWLRQRRRQSLPVLVHCHAGVGRSGSLVVAYLSLFAYPDCTYDEVVARVNERLRPRRHSIYPHVGLAESVHRLRQAPVSLDGR